MKRLSLILAAIFLNVVVFAQQRNFNAGNTASILRLHQNKEEIYALNTFTPSPVMAYHSPKYKAGIALLVIGPVDMAVGMGLIGWSIRNTGMAGDIPANNRRVALGAALGAFHLLSGAAITTGGAVLLHKGRRESASIYLRTPQPALRISRVNGNGFGVRTGLVF